MSVAKAREAAVKAQKERIQDAVARLSRPSQVTSASHGSKGRSAPTSRGLKLKRKQMATPREKQPKMSKKPKLTTCSDAELNTCSLCDTQDVMVNLQCVYCNAKMHTGCSASIAAGVGNVGGFADGSAYCSLQCYYSDRLTQPPLKQTQQEQQNPSLVCSTSLRSSNIESYPLSQFPSPERKSRESELFIEHTLKTPPVSMRYREKPRTETTTATTYLEGEDIKTALLRYVMRC
jgi:hypothetical protein